MRIEVRKSVCLGDLVAAAFDAAGRVSRNKRTTSWLATCTVRKVLLKTGRLDLARRLGK